LRTVAKPFLTKTGGRVMLWSLTSDGMYGIVNANAYFVSIKSVVFEPLNERQMQVMLQYTKNIYKTI
jgi:hypothetical protein